MLLVGIPTILFVIVIDLFIKKFNWDIAICCRILLSVIPILLILLLILVGAWIAKKNREKKLILMKPNPIADNYGKS